MPYNMKIASKRKISSIWLKFSMLKNHNCFSRHVVFNNERPPTFRYHRFGMFYDWSHAKLQISFVGHSLRSVNGNTVYSHNQIILNSVLILACPYSQFEDKHLNDS